MSKEDSSLTPNSNDEVGYPIYYESISSLLMKYPLSNNENRNNIKDEITSIRFKSYVINSVENDALVNAGLTPSNFANEYKEMFSKLYSKSKKYAQLICELADSKANKIKSDKKLNTQDIKDSFEHSILSGNIEDAIHELKKGRSINNFNVNANPRDLSRISLEHTPLTYAIKNRDISMVKFLLKNKANPQLQNANNLTPLQQAINKYELSNKTNKQIYLQIIKYLVRYGAVKDKLNTENSANPETKLLGDKTTHTRSSNNKEKELICDGKKDSIRKTRFEKIAKALKLFSKTTSDYNVDTMQIKGRDN